MNYGANRAFLPIDLKSSANFANGEDERQSEHIFWFTDISVSAPFWAFIVEEGESRVRAKVSDLLNVLLSVRSDRLSGFPIYFRLQWCLYLGTGNKL